MENCMGDFVGNRCIKALEDVEYLEMAKRNSDEVALRIVEQDLCYKRGFADAVAMLTGKF